ncbi:MAG: iron-containing redox enzyme family protein [Egibacteraceae bacterium]
MRDNFFAQLDGVIEREWAAIKAGPFAQHVMQLGVDKDLYKLAMLQIYHYTRHNAINQAFATWRVEPERIGVLRFCFEHASEELGHERMVVHDLESIGLFEPGDLTAPPLPATEAFIGYLYYVGLHYGAVPRLGYSYWAESVYGHIGDLLGRARSDLSLTDRQMSFFVAHAVIDEKHAEEVRRAIGQHAREGAERDLILQVARTTLRLTGALLDEVHHTYHVGAPECTASAA